MTDTEMQKPSPFSAIGTAPRAASPKNRSATVLARGLFSADNPFDTRFPRGVHDMTTEAFFAKIRTYADLSNEAEQAWASLLRSRTYRRDEPFIQAGDVPARHAFVVEGLFYQHYVGPEGDMIIKYFFPENRIAASASATLLGEPSLFAITAIEDSSVLEYDFGAFKGLVAAFPDIAAFYIRYMERHWIVEKEPDEISFRHDDAMKRYRDFIRREPELHLRLKQHHIAAWLGITPESLSRLRRAIAYGRLDRG